MYAPIAFNLKELTSLSRILEKSFYVPLVVAATSSFSPLIETQHGFSSQTAVTHGRKATLLTIIDAPITLHPRHL